MVHLDYRDARPIYIQIVDCFREQISAGVMAPDDKLPSVRELAMQLSINPNTIQRSYRQLETEGWIATVPGKGCFVAGVPHTVKEQQHAILVTFDDIVTTLLHTGYSRQDLANRILKGGLSHA